MAALSRAETKAMYSWWWDSHISPKNSKWLQENLADMDNKVKTMIKLIEVDEDSFARRAEMYYKKRPELMKLVEEFYRAYRALAERYDNATGVIRQAHRTMSEAFPNQVPSLMTDDGVTPDQTPVKSSSGFGSVVENGDFSDDSVSVADQKAKKQLNFHETEGNGDVNVDILSESERWRQFEIDIQALKEALAELEAEKEEKLSKLGFEVSRAKEISKCLYDRATVAEAEVQSLKETLAKVEAEKEADFLRYQQCLERISSLENGVSQSEHETESLKDELEQLKAEKESVFTKYMEALEKIASLENRLLLSETETETVRESLTKLTGEKANAEREVGLLRTEVQDWAGKLKESRKQFRLLDKSNKALQSELDSLVKKQMELGRVWVSVQNSHSEAQEKLRSVSAELEKTVRDSKDLQVRNQGLEDEIQKVKNDNSALSSENTALMAQLRITTENLEKLSERNTLFEKSLFDANTELEMLRMKSKNLEDSCCVFIDQNSVLATDKETLACQLGKTEKKVSALEEERASALQRVEELLELSQTRIGDLENTRKELEEELDKGISARFDVFILQNCIRDMNSVITQLLESNDEKEAVHLTETESLREKLFALQWAFEDLQKDNREAVEDKESLTTALEEASSTRAGLEAALMKINTEFEEMKSANYELKDLLSLKEMQLLEAMANKINQENRYTEQLRECESLRRLIKLVESRLSDMTEEREKTGARMTGLSSEVQKGRDEVELWETVAGAFFTELQSSSLREVIIKEKYSELVKAYEVLEYECCSKSRDVVRLEERVGVLEGENAQLKDQLGVGYSVILSLRDSLASIEKHAVWHKEVHRTDEQHKEDTKQCQNSNSNEVSSTQPNKISVLQEVQDRVQAVEKAIIDLKNHAEEQYSTVRSELDSAMGQIESLRSQRSSPRRRSVGLSRRPGSRQDCNLKNTSERAGDHLTRDIVLDQDWSSRQVNGSDDSILELWETTNQGIGIDLTVGKFSHVKAVRTSRNDRPSLESTVDKELCVDDQRDIAKELETDRDKYQRRIVNRLTSDVQKLSNLRITVHDLKEKLEMTGRFSTDGGESDGIKDQLVGTEDTISKLYDYSEKLIKKIESTSLASTSSSFDGSVTANLVDGGSTRRRRYADHARRISDKIGRLQSEIQKVQFQLMNIDKSKTTKGRSSEIVEDDSQTLLRDYLYSGPRVSSLKVGRKKMKKKSQFCGCMQNPATKGD